MTPGLARWLHVAALVVGGSGLVYAWMRYLARPADEFAVVNHPAQPHVQHLHILAAPLLLFLVALIWRSHVWARVRSGFAVRRGTGLALTILFFPMVASGYLVQTSEHELWRLAWIWIHGISSLGWIACYGIHLLRPSSAR